MIKYVVSKRTILFIILIFIIEALGIVIFFQRRELVKLIICILAFITSLPTYIAISQIEILIDENKITIKLGLPFLFKPKTMAWENVDIVGRDSIFGNVTYCLASRGPVKPKAINISGIKNMDSLIVEIVKRARFASIDPKILKLVEKYNEKKG